MTPAIETERLTKRFRRLRTWGDLVTAPWRRPTLVAVDDVDLAIPRGQVFGLLGQNGAGKTTLVRMLTTLLLPTAGRARVAGHDVASSPREVRRRIGLVSGDERSFYWRLTGRQNLEFFAALAHLPSSLAATRIASLAERLDAGETLDRPFGQLSTGQRQKLAIARGLLAEPEILFMDEPTRSLDPISATTIREFVAEHVIRELGSTVVLATHSMREAEALCGRVAFLQRGRIVAAGSVEELRRAIGYGQRARLVLRNVDGLVLVQLRSLPSVAAVDAVDASAVPESGPAEVTLEVALRGEADLAPMLRLLVERGVDVVTCSVRELSLEEIYVRTLQPESPPSRLTVAEQAVVAPR